MRAACQFLGLLLLCVTIVGCGEKNTKTIGISVQTMTNPFFIVIAETVEAEAAKHGYTVLVRDGENDVANQEKQVREFINQGVAAIILCPRDTLAIGEVIREANKAGIPVFTIDTACEDPNAEVVFHVGTDNLQGGEIAGEAMIEALGEAGGKVVVLELKKVDSCKLRVEGFTKAINEHNKTAANIIDIKMNLECEGDAEKGESVARDAMNAIDDLRGIFAINDPAAMGAYRAVEAEGKTDKITVIGFDGMPEGKKGVKEGHLFDTPTQFPDRMSVLCVEAIMKYFDGEEIKSPKKLIDTAPYRLKDAEEDPMFK